MSIFTFAMLLMKLTLALKCFCFSLLSEYQICETNGDTDVEGQEQEQLLEESHYEAKNIVQFKDGMYFVLHSLRFLKWIHAFSFY